MFTFACALFHLAATGLGYQTIPVQVAPFTQADLPGASRLSISGDPAQAQGTLGKGILATKPVSVFGVKLNPVEGLIEVWLKPDWPGNDGKRHVFWETAKAAGRQLRLEKSEKGMLRAIIETPDGPTAARTDISTWQPGVWRHIAVGWISNKGRNVGLALWVDKVCVDGPVTPHGVFDKVETPTSITLSDAAFDELIVRPDLKAEGGYGMIACVYRDYFRTAPLSAVKIDFEPTRVPSDRRAVAGFEKQFGLMVQSQGAWQPVVENVVRYSQWAYFDARQLIKWSTSDSNVATIDASGRVKALKPGKCEISAEFHGLKAKAPLEVISPDKPDFDLIGIELLPRYSNESAKDRPAPGDQVTARVRVGNFGLKPLPATATIRFEWRLEANRNYRLDADEKAQTIADREIGKALAPGEETYVEFKFPCPAVSTWMKVTLDPDNRIDEICEANNSLAELTDARPVHMGYTEKALKEYFDGRKLNHVGSFSYYDWIRAEKLRMDVMLRDAVWPTTGPNGVEEAYRLDKLTPLVFNKDGQAEEWDKENVLFDGGFPINEPVDLMAIDCAIIHEFGHTILSQPDLYGYVTAAENVFLKDGGGKPVAGTPELPVVMGESRMPIAPGVNVACGVGYPWLMDGCQLWLDPSQAGHIQFFKGYRRDRFWGTQGRLIPVRANYLSVTDAFDNPLKGAAVYVYHVSQAPVQDSGAMFFADRPKFMGQTDADGRFLFPGDTDQDWDDPDTDAMDGAKPVWNPFGTPASETAFTPNVWEVEGLLLIKIVSGSRTEYQFLDLTQFNVAFLSNDVAQAASLGSPAAVAQASRIGSPAEVAQAASLGSQARGSVAWSLASGKPMGNHHTGIYPIRTSLLPTAEPTPLVRKPVPEAIRKVNKAPVAAAPKEITVKVGEEFEIDGSKSFDPEGQPLIYRWNEGGGWLRGNVSQGPKLKQKAPNEPKVLEFKFWVLDGVRSSEAAIVKVNVVK